MPGENGEEITPKLDMCPEINYERLKNMSLKELVNAVNQGAQVIEPIGGSLENIFVLVTFFTNYYLLKMLLWFDWNWIIH